MPRSAASHLDLRCLLRMSVRIHSKYGTLKRSVIPFYSRSLFSKKAIHFWELSPLKGCQFFWRGTKTPEHLKHFCHQAFFADREGVAFYFQTFQKKELYLKEKICSQKCRCASQFSHSFFASDMWFYFWWLISSKFPTQQRKCIHSKCCFIFSTTLMHCLRTFKILLLTKSRR